VQLHVPCRVGQPAFDRLGDAEVDDLGGGYAVVEVDVDVRWLDEHESDATADRRRLLSDVDDATTADAQAFEESVASDDRADGVVAGKLLNL